MEVLADVAPDTDRPGAWVYVATGQDVLVWLIEGSLVLTRGEVREEVVPIVALGDED